MKTQFMKFTLAASIGLALAFTFSCSDDGGDGNGGDGGGSSEVVETYALESVDKDAGTFTYTEEDSYERCNEGGILETVERSNPRTVSYSIANGIMTYGSSDTLNFSGTSSELAGTWTRTKNADASCKPDSDDEAYKRCKNDYDITKMVFDNSTVKIIRDYCRTDRYLEGSTMYGGTVKIISCDTYELHNGTDKIRFKVTKTLYEVSYKGKTCGFDESKFTEAQKNAACKETWTNRDPNDNNWYEGYEDALQKDFNNCLKGFTRPAWYED